MIDHRHLAIVQGRPVPPVNGQIQEFPHEQCEQGRMPGEALGRVAQGDPFLDRLKSRTTLGRRGRSKELAGALLFPASDASSIVTGQALTVDGGWTIT
jgi:NAD(P)-dependent dehydrogenase (short-subunit alcohol dehydrogenase family)